MSEFLTLSQVDDMNDEFLEVIGEWLGERHGDIPKVPILESMNLERDFGVDSLEGIEFTCELGKRLRIEIPLEENILVSCDKNGRKKIRTVGQIAARLFELSNVTLPG